MPQPTTDETKEEFYNQLHVCNSTMAVLARPLADYLGARCELWLRVLSYSIKNSIVVKPTLLHVGSGARIGQSAKTHPRKLEELAS